MFLSVAARAVGGWREAYAGFVVNGNIVSEEEFNTSFHAEEEIRHHLLTTANINAILFDELHPHDLV